MPPSKESCQILASALDAKSGFLTQISKTRKALLKKRDLKRSLKYGITGLGKIASSSADLLKRVADISSAELLTAVESVAVNIAGKYVSEISSSGGAVLKGIVSNILKILLAYPNSIFSLVSIPLTAARAYVQRERQYLYNAKTSLDIIMSIIVKWERILIDDNRYYVQMVTAKPYIEECLRLVERIINNISDSNNDDSSYPLVFNESDFKNLQDSLSKAIQITKPTTNIEAETNVDAIIEDSAEKLYKEMAKSIEFQYTKDKERITKTYLSKVESQEKTTVYNELSYEAARESYATNLSIAEANRDTKLSEARADSYAKAVLDLDNYKRALRDTAEQFSYEAQILVNQLIEFKDSLGKAFVNYKKSQIMCANIYNSRVLIKSLISEMIAFIKGEKNKTDKVTDEDDEFLKKFKKARDNIGVTNIKFDNAIKRFNENGNDSISAVELSQTVFTGNLFLNIADGYLESVVINELITLLNTKNTLIDASGNYDNFLNNVAGIPDWDGKLNVWAVTFSTVPSPYITIIAKSAELVAKMPALAISRNRNGQDAVNNSVQDVRKQMGRLLAHNGYVQSVLYSYDPYTNSDLIDVIKVLSNCNLLETFAETMSVATLATGIIADVAYRGFSGISDQIPTYSKCQIYPDLFDNKNCATSASKQRNDMPPKGWLDSDMTAIEESIIDINGLKMEVDSLILPLTQDAEIA